MKTITMSLTKVHKSLAEYAELDDKGLPVTKPWLSPIYVRKENFPGETLPNAFTVTLSPTDAKADA